MLTPEDSAGPTKQRKQHAQDFYVVTGRSKSTKRYSMLDDALGRAWMRQKISAEEYAALRRYALHWLAGGLLGPMQSVDLNRVFSFDPGAMSGLAKTERQQYHRDLYRTARSEIGRRPAFVADQVACYDTSLAKVGIMLGYQSEAHGRDAAREILSDAGYRLIVFWKDRDR